MDILKRSLAPISDDAWKEIDDQAKRTIKGNLSARGLVDFNGPHGWSFSAVNLGRLKLYNSQPIKGVCWGAREVMPLLETRVSFSLNLMEIDSISRGVKDPDLEPLQEAAAKAALFEETVVYHGFKEGKITGIIEASAHKPLSLSKSASSYADTIESAIVTLEKSGIGGPYALVLGTIPYPILMRGDEKGYPLKKRILDMLRGDIYWSPALDGGVLLSTRGGDFEMTVGQDLSIGFEGADKGSVRLYFTESLAFQVIEPAAAIELKLQK